MPIQRKPDGWYWGSKGPFKSRAKAQQVATAAYASGYKKENQMEKYKVGEFIGTLLHSATIAHFMHLQTTSYAAHVALGTYYDEIVDLVDAVAESVQGCYGNIIRDYPNMFSNAEIEPLAYMESLKNYVSESRQNLPQDSNIQNEIDNIATLIDSTLYKLRFLK